MAKHKFYSITGYGRKLLRMVGINEKVIQEEIEMQKKNGKETEDHDPFG